MKLIKVKPLFEDGLEDRILISEFSNCNINTLKHRVEQWKASGYTIVFTAGVFDLFTINHLLALYHYRLLGGDKAKLVLSIDTDERVNKSKAFREDKGGSIKPILSWRSRAMMVAKQSFQNQQDLVDLIIQHGESTCNGIRCAHDDNVTIAEIIKPDVVVVTSTSNDTIQKIQESSLIDNEKLVVIQEGELAYEDALLKKKISTTAIVQRIKHGN